MKLTDRYERVKTDLAILRDAMQEALPHETDLGIKILMKGAIEATNNSRKELIRIICEVEDAEALLRK